MTRMVPCPSHGMTAVTKINEEKNEATHFPVATQTDLWLDFLFIAPFYSRSQSVTGFLALGTFRRSKFVKLDCWNQSEPIGRNEIPNPVV